MVLDSTSTPRVASKIILDDDEDEVVDVMDWEEEPFLLPLASLPLCGDVAMTI